MDTKALKWLEERGVEIFKQAVLSEFYGYDLFEKEGGNYYRFQPHAQGDAVCLRPIGGRHEEYEAFLIEEAVKYPDQGIFPALCDFSHCEPVQRHFLDDSLLQRIENQLKQGGQTFAQKVNQAFVNVLMMAAGPIETRVEVRDTGLDVLLAQVGDGLSEAGFDANRFLFPRRVKGKLLQQKIIIRDNEIQNNHYLGKTIAGLYAFWSDELPDDTALIFDSTACVTITEEPYFWCRERIAAFTSGICGMLRLNPIVKNSQSVIAIEGVEKLLTPKTISRVTAREMTEAEKFLNNIEEEIKTSLMEEAFKETALYDLEQARICYKSEAFKACIIMLGAVLEGLMLGTLRREDVLHRIRTDPAPPKVIKRLGLSDPKLVDKIAEELGFEDYKNIFHHLIPDIEKLKVEGIQGFRNAVHPWKAVRDPTLYADYDRVQTRAMHYLTSLEILAHCILSWTP